MAKPKRTTPKQPAAPHAGLKAALLPHHSKKHTARLKRAKTTATKHDDEDDQSSSSFHESCMKQANLRKLLRHCAATICDGDQEAEESYAELVRRLHRGVVRGEGASELPADGPEGWVLNAEDEFASASLGRSTSDLSLGEDDNPVRALERALRRSPRCRRGRVRVVRLRSAEDIHII